MNVEIEIVGRVSKHAEDNTELPDLIEKLLQCEPQKMVHGGSFTGRPSTQIYCDQHHVVKVHTEYSFCHRDAKRWVDQALEKEQRLGVHHPDKTWFLIKQDEQITIANIAPRLTAIHCLHEHLPTPQLPEYLHRLMRMLLKIAATHKELLDSGLSNFAIDRNDQLYYIDDDIYRWDNFTSFGQTLGFWIRSLDWFDTEVSEKIGQELSTLLPELFNDSHSVITLTGHLRSAHFTQDKFKLKRDAILKGLMPQVKNTSVKKAPSSAPMALLSDIHANYPALQAVLAELKAEGISNALVLGDIVGYGPHPLECINEIRKHDFSIIKGNHDYACSENNFSRGFSKHARHVAEWTRDILDEESRQWLHELPPYIENENWLAVHGSPQDRSYLFGYVYTMTYESNLNNLLERNIRICFHGHTHIQGAYYRNEKGDSFSDAPEQDLNNYRQTLISPGSIGQPRERKGTAARYGVYHPKTRQLELRQVDYDVDQTIQHMTELKFPSVLSERLREGI